MKVVDPVWAWAAYEPDENAPWNLIRAGHLLRRAGFGADWNQLQAALLQGPEHTIHQLINPADPIESFNQSYDIYEESAEADSAEALAAWWLRRMIETPQPLLEKLTLFWHSHFAISSTRVGNLGLVAAHVRTLRRYAFGDYRELLAAVMQDPATFLTLESSQNRKNPLNTSVARQLLEQYTLGSGLTKDKEVREAARAFTGWFVRRERLQFVPREHDNAAKSFLGRSGPWNKRDILNILADQPALARLVVRRLYHLLISETEDAPDSLIGPLADSFSEDFKIGRLVQTILQSNLFFSKWAYRKRIKSPVEYALGIVIAMEARVPTLALSHDVKRLGQNLFDPPTRKGWVGGRAWLNSSTVIQRANIAGDLLSANGRYAGIVKPREIMDGSEPVEARAQLQRLSGTLLQGDLDAKVSSKLKQICITSAEGSSEQFRRLAHGLVTLPEFQLA